MPQRAPLARRKAASRATTLKPISADRHAAHARHVAGPAPGSAGRARRVLHAERHRVDGREPGDSTAPAPQPAPPARPSPAASVRIRPQLDQQRRAGDALADRRADARRLRHVVAEQAVPAHVGATQVRLDHRRARRRGHPRDLGEVGTKPALRPPSGSAEPTTLTTHTCPGPAAATRLGHIGLPDGGRLRGHPERVGDAQARRPRRRGTVPPRAKGAACSTAGAWAGSSGASTSTRSTCGAGCAGQARLRTVL